MDWLGGHMYRLSCTHLRGSETYCNNFDDLGKCSVVRRLPKLHESPLNWYTCHLHGEIRCSRLFQWQDAICYNPMAH